MPKNRFERVVPTVLFGLSGSSALLFLSTLPNQGGNEDFGSAKQHHETNVIEMISETLLSPTVIGVTSTTEDSTSREPDAPMVYLVSACPDPSVEMTYECELILDAFFTQKKIGHRNYQWIAFNNPLNYSRIFFDPVRDKERVSEALHNPTCSLNDKDDVRWDLYEECHAEAFTNLNQFTRKCINPQWYQSRLDYWFEEARGYKIDGKFMSKFDYRLSWIDSLSFEMRAMQINSLWEETLRTRWVVNQCEQFDVEKILIDPTRDQGLFEKLRSVGRVLGVDDGISVSYEVRESLRALAARFGEAWAVITHHGSPAWRTFRAEQYPWIYTNRELNRRDANRASKLEAGVQIVMELAESGIEFDWDYLVSHICTDQQETDSIDCQTAINALREKLDPIEADKLLVLGQIEKKSIELGIYDQTTTVEP
ncbi:MAG: hypothetical protein OXH31_04560 [Gammaproteobacteria bacterium]|nr:hypothetical protein [Gammaproteobacteria bacterium]